MPLNSKKKNNARLMSVRPCCPRPRPRPRSRLWISPPTASDSRHTSRPHPSTLPSPNHRVANDRPAATPRHQPHPTAISHCPGRRRPCCFALSPSRPRSTAMSRPPPRNLLVALPMSRSSNLGTLTSASSWAAGSHCPHYTRRDA